MQDKVPYCPHLCWLFVWKLLCSCPPMTSFVLQGMWKEACKLHFPGSLVSCLLVGFYASGRYRGETGKLEKGRNLFLDCFDFLSAPSPSGSSISINVVSGLHSYRDLLISKNNSTSLEHQQYLQAGLLPKAGQYFLTSDSLSSPFYSSSKRLQLIPCIKSLSARVNCSASSFLD